jgi:hypothetical protein
MATKAARHKWIKLRIHVYLCKVCGMGRVNSDQDGYWRTTYHYPTGISKIETRVPPCEIGEHTARYLAKYHKQITEWKGHRHAIGKKDDPKPDEAPF